MDCSFTPSCSRSVLFAETVFWVIWNAISVFTRRAQRSTHIDNFTNRQEHSGSRLQRWECAWAVVNPLDCGFQPFIGSTSPLFHSMFPCQRGGRRGRKLEDCCVFALWVDPRCRCTIIRWRGRYGSGCVIWLMRRWSITPREQILEWSQQLWVLRMLSWCWIRHVNVENGFLEVKVKLVNVRRWLFPKRKWCPRALGATQFLTTLLSPELSVQIP